jgi:hypothetical protein
MFDLSTVAGLGQLGFAALSYLKVGPEKIRDFALSTKRRRIAAGILFTTGLVTIVYGQLPQTGKQVTQSGAPIVTTAPIPTPPVIDTVPEARGQASERAPVRLAQAKQPPAKDATRPNVEQRTYGANSPNFLGDNNRFTIINPEVNPNATVVTYDFRGNRRETGPGISKLTVGAMEPVFKEMVKLQDERNWSGLRAVAERQMTETPEWLTPALFSGLAHAQIGEIDVAIVRLEHVQRRAAGNPDYADAARIRQQIREQTGR